MFEDKDKKFGGTEAGGTGVKFEDSNWRAVKYYREPTTPEVVQWVMKHSGGLVKNAQQASYVLLGFATLAIIISLFLFFGGGETSKIRPENFENKQQFLP